MDYFKVLSFCVTRQRAMFCKNSFSFFFSEFIYEDFKYNFSTDTIYAQANESRKTEFKWSVCRKSRYVLPTSVEVK